MPPIHEGLTIMTPEEQTQADSSAGTIEAGSLDSLLEKSFKPKGDDSSSDSNDG